MRFLNSRGGVGFVEFRRISWGILNFFQIFPSSRRRQGGPGGPGMRSGGPTVGPGGARARARGGQGWGQGGPGLGPGGGHGPPGPPAGYGPGHGALFSDTETLCKLFPRFNQHKLN